MIYAVLSVFVSTISAQDTLTVAQMQEDFNYMIEQYERIHPNPMWSLGEERYNELKQQTLAQLDRQMPLLDFWRIIARWNQHFDGHTQLAWPAKQSSGASENVTPFPPKSVVQYRDRKLFFGDYVGMPDSLRGYSTASAPSSARRPAASPPPTSVSTSANCPTPA